MAKNGVGDTTAARFADERRILHSMLRVGDMDRSVDFYTRVLGMRVLRTLDQPSEQYSLTFLGYQDESHGCALELTYNYGVAEYQLGTAYGHLAIQVKDCRQACEEVKAKGGTVIMEPQPLQGANEVIAFVSDPDGYAVELIERH